MAVGTLIALAAAGCGGCAQGIAAALFPQLLPGGERPPLDPLIWEAPTPALEELPKELHEWYTPPPQGHATQVRVGVAALHAYTHEPWMHEYLLAQKGQQEIAVAALGVFFLLLPKQHLATLLSWRWHLWPVEQMRQECAMWLEQVRQVGHVKGEDPTDPIGPYLAKFRNLLGRDLAEADWEAERAAALPSYSWRTLNGSRRRYLKSIYSGLLECARSMVWSLPNHTAAQTLEQFWEHRAINTPGGSSSERHLLDEYRQGDSGSVVVTGPTKKESGRPSQSQQ